jgi:hypothetical protein
MNEAEKKFIEVVSDIVWYWAKNEDRTSAEKCEGTAFSILVLLDGGCPDAPAYDVRPLDCSGKRGKNIAGALHEIFAEFHAREGREGF